MSYSTALYDFTVLQLAAKKTGGKMPLMQSIVLGAVFLVFQANEFPSLFKPKDS